MNSPQKVLIVQTAFLGDVILATALLEKIKNFHPNCDVDFLLRKGNETVFENNPLLSNLIIWDKSKKIKDLFRIFRIIRAKKYDLVLNCQRYFTSGLITICSNAKVTRGFTKNPFSFLFTKRYKHFFDGSHEIERNQKMIADFTDINFAKPKIYTNNNSTFDFKYITISPGSIWATKQFPKEKWKDFVDLIPSDIYVYILGSKADIEISNWIVCQTKRDNIATKVGELSIVAAASLMKNAVMNYVNDSAPLHIASAVDAPVCAIFCSTTPQFGYGPLSTKSITIETKIFLSCKPCGTHGKSKCPLQHFDCGKKIDVQQLINLIL